jgi:glycosyltransferase involved in cell wall biosynthesis
MPSVSLCLIARNEAANLRACLGPLVSLVGETIVVDTGSTDATPQKSWRILCNPACTATAVPFAW